MAIGYSIYGDTQDVVAYGLINRGVSWWW